MSRKNSVMIFADRIARDIVAEQTRVRIMMGFDAALIAAHEALGMGPGRAAAFAPAYSTALDALATLYLDDGSGDRTMEYAKVKRDERIRAIVGDENFVEFDRSYGPAYMDELRRVRVLQAENVKETFVDKTKEAAL